MYGKQRDKEPEHTHEHDIIDPCVVHKWWLIQNDTGCFSLGPTGHWCLATGATVLPGCIVSKRRSQTQRRPQCLGRWGMNFSVNATRAVCIFSSNFVKITAGPWAPCVVPPNDEDMLLLLDGVAIRSPAMVLEHLATATPTVTVPLLPWNCLA